MDTLIQNNEAIATLIARVFAGLLFFFQGYDVVFNIKIRNAIGAYEDSFANKGIPKFLTVAGTWYTSFTELICGFLLIAGLFEYPALYLLGLNMVIASIAFGINTPVWDTKHVFPRLLLVILLLAVPHEWNFFSLDNLFFNNK